VLWNTYKPKSTKLPEAFIIIICLSSKCKPLGLTNKTAVSWFNVYVLLRFVSTKEMFFYWHLLNFVVLRCFSKTLLSSKSAICFGSEFKALIIIFFINWTCNLTRLSCKSCGMLPAVHHLL
jgi:hypothetical protein